MNEEWWNHLWTPNKIHPYSESLSWSQKDIQRWWVKHQDLELSYKNLGIENNRDQGIQGLGINVDGSSLQKIACIWTWVDSTISCKRYWKEKESDCTQS